MVFYEIFDETLLDSLMNNIHHERTRKKVRLESQRQPIKRSSVPLVS